MMKATAQVTSVLLVWQAITPVHSGTGQTSASVIDLPIAREIATGFPILPASSIKGVFRDGDGLQKGQENTITEGDKRYGFANKGEKNQESQASKLTFTDARLLCLPVRSYAGTFAYVTCPLVLNRLRRDLVALGFSTPYEEVKDIGVNEAYLGNNSVLIHKDKVLFEDIDLTARESVGQSIATALTKIINIDLSSRLAIISDDIFAFFSETATEVTAHTALDPQMKIVKDGALWYEEALPAESLLTSFVLLAENTSFSPPSLLQIGGKGSVGRGLLKIHVSGKV